MAIITLTTDFGIKDHFAGAVKGALLSEISDAKVVDISHDISPFSILEAAYVIQNAFSSFPVGSIHIIGVDSEISEENMPSDAEMAVDYALTNWSIAHNYCGH